MKSIFKSKTFWLNILSGVGVITGLIPANPYTMAISAVANVILRTVTNQPVSIPVINPNPILPNTVVVAAIKQTSNPLVLSPEVKK